MVIMTNVFDLHQTRLKDPEYKAAYDALEEEFADLSAALTAQNKESPEEQQ
jgi:hypothetical protein